MRKHRERSATVMLSVLLVGVGFMAAGCPRPHPALGHDPCAVERLATPPGDSPPSAVIAGDRTGRFLIGRAFPTSSASGRLLLWDGGKPIVVPVSGPDAELSAVNSQGTAIGHTRGVDGTLTSFMYHDGATTRLAGRNSVAVALNDRGAAAGYAGTKPVWWRGFAAEPEPLPLPGNDWRGEALAIGDDGVIVGRVWPPAPSTSSRAYAWFPDGSHRELPDSTTVAAGVAVDTTAAVAVAYRDGWAVGRTSDPAPSAIRWNLRRPNESPVTVGQLSPEVVNASGTMAGAGTRPLSTGQVSVALSTSLPGYVVDREVDVTALSDDGHALAGTLTVTPISGGQGVGAAVRIAVRWRCGA